MNTSEETMVMGTNESNEENVTTAIPMAESNDNTRNNNRCNTAAGTVAGFVAGALAGTAAGVAYEKNNKEANDEREHAEDLANNNPSDEASTADVQQEQQEQQVQQEQQIQHEQTPQEDHVSQTVVDSKDETNHRAGGPGQNVVEQEPEVHYVGIDFIDEDGDGEVDYVAGAMTINGQRVVFADLDFDATFDIAVIDKNNNGVIDEGEVLDVRELGMQVGDFFAHVVDENPEGAAHIVQVLNTMVGDVDEDVDEQIDDTNLEENLEPNEPSLDNDDINSIQEEESMFADSDIADNLDMEPGIVESDC